MDKFDSNKKENHRNNPKTDLPVPYTPEPSISGGSEKNNSIKDGGSDKCQYEKPNDLPYWIQAYSSIAIVFCTIVIAVITGIYTHFAAKQATQMEKAVNVASDTEIRGLRAYINISKVTITNIANPLPSEKSKNYKPTGAEITNRRRGPFIDIEIINSGQTPAYKVEGWATPKTLEFPLKSALPGKDVKQIKQLLIVNRDIPVQMNTSMQIPLTDSEKAALRDGSKAIYINGEITYTDVFKQIRHTKFKLGHNAPISGLIGISKAVAVLEEEAD